MYMINITRAIKIMSVNKIRDFIFEKNIINELDFLRETVISQ